MSEEEKTGINALLDAAGAPLKEMTAEESAIPKVEQRHKPNNEPSLADKATIDHGKTIEDIVKEEAKEADDQPVNNFSLSRTLGGAIVAKAIQKQIWLVILIFAFLIIYISNRYICQQQIVKIDKLEHQVVEMRYKATVCKSILTEKSRESNIIKLLEAKGDSTLTVPTTPPYKIMIDE